MNIPNILTAIRFCLIPLFVYEFLAVKDPILSVSILIVSGVTDVLDGWIARRFQMVTKWGTIFDPVADKFTQIAVAFCLAYSGIGVMWVAFGVLVAKELALIFGGLALYKKRQDMVFPSKWYGKVNTLLIYLLFFVLILFGPRLSATVKVVMVCVALVCSMLALAKYAADYFFQVFRRA